MRNRLATYAITAAILGLLVVAVPSTLTPQLALQEQRDARQLASQEAYSPHGEAVRVYALSAASGDALRVIGFGAIAGLAVIIFYTYFVRRV